MPAITEKQPEKVTADVAKLRTQLAQTIPAKQLDHNLLIATWNLRAFGGLTEKWAAGPDDTPKRDYGDLARIAEIVSHFDVIAMQEVRGDIKALRHLLKTLGDEWAMILTDVTKGKAGNDERMAFSSIPVGSGPRAWRASSSCRRSRAAARALGAFASSRARPTR